MFDANFFFWLVEQCLDKLKCIDLKNSQNLTQTPDFTGVPRLETLYLSWCRNLVEIHSSIGQLRRLVVLDLEGCESLTNLPSMTTKMESLTILNLCYCSKIRKIPEFNGIMKSLSELYLGKTAIEKLPESIMCLTSLTLLNLRDCKNLKCLTFYTFSLRSLEKLVVSGCSKLARRPVNSWELHRLKELDLSGNSFVTMPISIWQLLKLEALDLSGCSKLKSLPLLPLTVRYINAKDCHSMIPLPLQPTESRAKVTFKILHSYLQVICSLSLELLIKKCIICFLFLFLGTGTPLSKKYQKERE